MTKAYAYFPSYVQKYLFIIPEVGDFVLGFRRLAFTQNLTHE